MMIYIFIRSIMEHLEKKEAWKIEGLFRVSGDLKLIWNLKKKYEKGSYITFFLLKIILFL